MKDFSILSDRFKHLNNNLQISFDCGSGWYDLLENLLSSIDSHLKTLNEEDPLKSSFRIEQVKEKFGTLRFYVNDLDDDIYEFIQIAEKKSGEVCELCGEPGENFHYKTYLYTYCKNDKVKLMKLQSGQ